MLNRWLKNKPANTSTNSPTRRFRFMATGIWVSWLVALVVALGLQRYAFQSYQVFGQSMQPTLEEGDYLIISKLPITFSSLKGGEYSPDRGEIVVIESPLDNSRLIKRVIGLSGERITVRNGSLRVYNEQSPQGFDPYVLLGLPALPVSGQLSTTVPEDHIFVVGDNRGANGSLDSRNELGTVSNDSVVGKLLFRLWPFSQIKHF